MRRCERSDDAALEAQHQVLADRLDRLEHAAVDPLGHALGLRARMRRLDLEPLADEHLQAPRRPVERVALGHVSHGNVIGHTVVQELSWLHSLNIAALTQRTGVPPDTIRKWEQRYGVLRPDRTAGGQRRYSEVDVARVRVAAGAPG